MQVNDNKGNQKKVEKLIFEKGITLVALVVTIIVLLILAGITINMATSGSGIFARAKNAANVYRQAVKDENTALDSYANEINKVIEESKGENKTQPTEESYIGYYADIDNDGRVDGVIYADMAKGNDIYGISPKTHLKNYRVSNVNYTEKFGTKPVVMCTTAEITSHDMDRFYVMALKDIGGSDGSEGSKNTVYDWYCSAVNKMSDYATYTSNDFGTGRLNTKNMITKWNDGSTKDSNGNYGGYGKQDACSEIKEGSNAHKDLWGQIKNKLANTGGVSDSWFVPSKVEWQVFKGALGITDKRADTEHYFVNLGLSSAYWSSSQKSDESAWLAKNVSAIVLGDTVSNAYSVRLSATF